MKISLPLLVLGAAILVPVGAQAQPGFPPGLNPGALNAATQRAQQSDVLYWYNLLPPNVFGAFGNADRLELLQNKGAIYNKNSGFIEVLAPGDANESDVEKLQVKLYQGQQGLMVAVSQIVWNQPRTKGALAFFALGQDGQLMEVTRQVFPYDLTAPRDETPDNDAPQTDAPQTDAPDNDAPQTDAQNNAPDANDDAKRQGTPTLNAYLSPDETTISTGVPESEEAGDDYIWNGTTFDKSEAPRNNGDEPRDEPRNNGDEPRDNG